MNLHHQHQYSEDRESEKMDEIARLEAVNQDLSDGIAAVNSAIYENRERIAELKKADEVKEVFPKSGYRCDCTGYASVIDNSNAWASVGDIFNTKEESLKNHERKKARKHIIEEINKVNKGNNGFDEERCLLVWDHDENELGFIGERQRQHCEPGMYINSSLDANSLVFKKDIIDACKIIFGIE